MFPSLVGDRLVSRQAPSALPANGTSMTPKRHTVWASVRPVLVGDRCPSGGGAAESPRERHRQPATVAHMTVTLSRSTCMAHQLLHACYLTTLPTLRPSCAHSVIGTIALTT